MVLLSSLFDRLLDFTRCSLKFVHLPKLEVFGWVKGLLLVSNWLRDLKSDTKGVAGTRNPKP